MAKLTEQAVMVRRLDTFFVNTEYTDSKSYGVRLRNISDGGIPKGDFLLMCLMNMSSLDWLNYIFRRKYYVSPRYQLHRMNKIENLLKNCFNDGFIEAVKDIDTVNIKPLDLIKVSREGSDLIHLVGFLNIAWNKYSKVFIFFSGAGLTVFLTIFLLILRALFNHYWGLNL